MEFEDNRDILKIVVRENVKRNLPVDFLFDARLPLKGSDKNTKIFETLLKSITSKKEIRLKKFQVKNERFDKDIFLDLGIKF